MIITLQKYELYIIQPNFYKKIVAVANRIALNAHKVSAHKVSTLCEHFLKWTHLYKLYLFFKKTKTFESSLINLWV